MVDLQVGLKERRCAHPKMEHLRTVICHWITKNEQRRRKALVVLEREFPSLSVEILDIFQSIKGIYNSSHISVLQTQGKILEFLYFSIIIGIVQIKN